MEKYKYLLLLVLCFVPNILPAFESSHIDYLADKKTWRMLLHIDKDGNPKIGSKDFYFTVTPINAKDELIATIENKNCENICRFPARYFWISKELDLNISFDHCKHLSEYIEQTGNSSLSYVYVSSYLGSPVSYFGHSFLRTDRPSNPMFSWTIGFAAKIDTSHLWQTVKDGLTSNLEGIFIFKEFYKVLDEYNNYEQRSVVIYPLRYPPDKVKLILLHFYELYGLNIEYGLFRNNCAYWVLYLLDTGNDKEDLMKDISRVILPKDIVGILSKHDLILNSETKTYTPLVNNIYLAYELLDANRKKEFLNILNSSNKTKAIDEKVQNKENRNLYAYLLSSYYEMIFKKFGISKSDYLDVKHLVFTNIDSLEKSRLNIAKERGSGKVEFSYLKKENSRTVTVRPLLFNRLQDYDNQINESTLEVLNFSIQNSNHQTKLRRVDILKIEAYSKNFPLYRPYSWRLYLGFNHSIPGKALHPVLEIGLGKSYGYKNLLFYLLGQASLHAKNTNAAFEMLYGLSWWIDDELHIGIDAKQPIANTSMKNAVKPTYFLYGVKNFSHGIYATVGLKTERSALFSVGVRF